MKLVIVNDNRHLKKNVLHQAINIQEIPTCTPQRQELFRLKKDPCTGELICEQSCKPPCKEPEKEKCKKCQK